MWRLLIGLVLSLISVLLFFLAYKLGWKYMIQEKRCTEKTTGQVVGYSVFRQGDSLYAYLKLNMKQKRDYLL